MSELIPRFALIIGAMKSGTTTLYVLLGQHPEICRSDIKEPNFFSDGTTPKDPADYYKLWEFDPNVHRWALEASTAYTKYGLRDGMAEEISRFPADFRLIYILRDPVDRIESNMAHNLAKGRKEGLRNGEVYVQPHVLETSKYATQLDHYRSVMPDVPVLLLDMTDLATPEGTRSVLRRCTEFLEIDPEFSFREITPKNVRERGGQGDRAVLSEAQRAELRDALRDDVHRLRSKYGFDTSHWAGFD